MNEDSLKREKIKEEIKVDEIYKFVINQIEEHELYLSDHLKLNWLAEELEIKAEYISVTLKENNFDNFKMFINYLKVKKAKELIKRWLFEENTILKHWQKHAVLKQQIHFIEFLKMKLASHQKCF